MVTATRVEAENPVKFDKNFYNEQVNKVINSLTPEFIAVAKSYVSFNLIFAAVGVTEVLLILLLFTFWSHSSILAFTLAALFLTFFSYFILRLYFLSKKPEQFQELKNQYIAACQKLIQYREGIPEHHLALASAAYLFAAALQGKEYQTYQLKGLLSRYSSYIEKLSFRWHWHDFHKFKEMLLQTSINEHIKLVKCEPTNLEAHAALANAYVMLSGLYADPKKFHEEEDKWIIPKKFTEHLHHKFKWTSERAIEEFKILNDYAPNDPWIHAQLAYSYRDLKMPLEEIKEYEIIMKLRPDDKETLFKLGALYFQEGQNAHGLRVYEDLKKTNYKKAETLIGYYGSYNPT